MVRILQTSQLASAGESEPGGRHHWGARRSGRGERLHCQTVLGVVGDAAEQSDTSPS